MRYGEGYYLQGAMRGSASRTARKLFEKSFLDLQKLLKMGVIKPRPLGEVAAVGLTERALCATPLRRTPPPPRRRCRLTRKIPPTPHSCKHGSALAVFFLPDLWSGTVGRFCIKRTTHQPIGVGTLDDPSKRSAQRIFDAQTERFVRTMTTFPKGEGAELEQCLRSKLDISHSEICGLRCPKLM